MEILKINPLDPAFDKCYLYYLQILEADEDGLITVNGEKYVSLFDSETRMCYLSNKSKARELYHNSFLITLDYLRTSVNKFHNEIMFDKKRSMEQMMAEEIFACLMDGVCHNLHKSLKKEMIKDGVL